MAMGMKKRLSYIGVMLTLAALVFAYQNCGEVNLLTASSELPIEEIIQTPPEFDPPDIESPPPPEVDDSGDTPYVVREAKYFLVKQDTFRTSRTNETEIEKEELQIKDGQNSIKLNVNVTHQKLSTANAVADWDLDGVEDLAYVVSNSAHLRYLVVAGSRNAGPRNFLLNDQDSLGQDPIFSVGDFDGDGITDLVTSAHSAEWFAVALSTSTDQKLKYFRIPHGLPKGKLIEGRDTNKDGFTELWYQTYIQHEKKYYFSLLDLKSKSVVKEFSVAKNNSEIVHKLEISPISEDVNGDKVADYFLLEQKGNLSKTARVLVLNGKSLLQSGQVDILNTFSIAHSQGVLDNNHNIAVGDFHSSPGLELVSSNEKLVTFYSINTGLTLASRALENHVRILTHADDNKDGFDDVILEVYDHGRSARIPGYSMGLANGNGGFFQREISSRISARTLALLKEATPSPPTRQDLSKTLLSAIPADADCKDPLIRPVGFSQSTDTWAQWMGRVTVPEALKSNSFDGRAIKTLPRGSSMNKAISRARYVSLPFIANETFDIGHANYEAGAGGKHKSFYVTVSKCPGDFRKAVRTPPKNDPSLSQLCRKMLIGEGRTSIASIHSGNDHYCHLVRGQKYYLNIIAEDPFQIESGLSSCPSSEGCGMLMTFQ